MGGRRHWQLIIYDVRSPRRLQRLHRYLRTCAYPLQESVFAWHGTEQELLKLQAELLKRINPREDDLRGYRLPAGAVIHLWGQSPFTEGVFDSGRPPHRHYEGELWEPRPERDFPLATATKMGQSSPQPGTQAVDNCRGQLVIF